MTQSNLFLSSIPTEELEAELARRKADTSRKYCKTLDKRLVGLLREIVEYMAQKKERSFNPRHVWQTDIDAHHKIADFQKLHYWEIIARREKHCGWWYVTNLGKDFMKGRIQLPKRVWVQNNKVVKADDEMVFIGKLDERWQTDRPDWAMDFIMNYEAVS
jgi:hypothetical protein